MAAHSHSPALPSASPRFLTFLLIVRLISMAWAFIRLYDFRLTRIREDLRTEYGLFTRVTATVPIRRVQKITVRAGPLHRWLERTTVRVETAGGAGGKSAAHAREWLAPLLREQDLPALLQGVLPGFDVAALTWQPVHPRAFARAVKPGLVVTAVVTLVAAVAIGWGALGILMLMLPWTLVSARTTREAPGLGRERRDGGDAQRLALAAGDAGARGQDPVGGHAPVAVRCRAAMARVHIDTAGAGEFSSRVDVPYLAVRWRRGFFDRLSAQAANTAFRW